MHLREISQLGISAARASTGVVRVVIVEHLCYNLFQTLFGDIVFCPDKSTVENNVVDGFYVVFVGVKDFRTLLSDANGYVVSGFLVWLQRDSGNLGVLNEPIISESNRIRQELPRRLQVLSVT